MKTHLRGRQIVLRSNTSELVLQEFYGLLLAHFAVRSLMYEAALHGKADPGELFFVHAVRVVKRKSPTMLAIPPQPSPDIHEAVLAEILEVRVNSSRGRHNPKAIMRKGRYVSHP